MARTVWKENTPTKASQPMVIALWLYGKPYSVDTWSIYDIKKAKAAAKDLQKHGIKVRLGFVNVGWSYLDGERASPASAATWQEAKANKLVSGRFKKWII